MNSDSMLRIGTAFCCLSLALFLILFGVALRGVFPQWCLLDKPRIGTVYDTSIPCDVNVRGEAPFTTPNGDTVSCWRDGKSYRVVVIAGQR